MQHPPSFPVMIAKSAPQVKRKAPMEVPDDDSLDTEDPHFIVRYVSQLAEPDGKNT